jgi:hypothetical protein
LVVTRAKERARRAARIGIAAVLAATVSIALVAGSKRFFGVGRSYVTTVIAERGRKQASAAADAARVAAPPGGAAPPAPGRRAKAPRVTATKTSAAAGKPVAHAKKAVAGRHATVASAHGDVGTSLAVVNGSASLATTRGARLELGDVAATKPATRSGVERRRWIVEGGSWSGPRWGATVDEVLQSTSGDAHPVEDGRAPKRRRALSPTIVQNTTMAGQQVAVSYFFGMSGKLSSVRVAPASEAPNVVLAYDELAAWLAATNGPPSAQVHDGEPAGTWIRICRWSTPDTRIDLRAWRTRLQDARVLTLRLADATIEPAQSLGVDLTYQPLPDALERGP